MTLKEAQTLTLRVLKQVMEEKLDQHNVQLAQVRISCVFHQVSTIDLARLILQVTPEHGFEILDEVRLKALIDEM